MRSVVARCLLIVGFALPLSAWAVDTDGDGVDDSIDAFPTYPEATTDTDGDGQPNSIDNSKSSLIVFSDFFNGAVEAGWTGVVTTTTSNSSWSLAAYGYTDNGSLLAKASGQSPAYLTRSVTIPASGGSLSFWHKLYSGGTGSYSYLYIDNVQINNSLFTSTLWRNAIYALTPGTHTLTWKAVCGNSAPVTVPCGYLDDVEIRASASLVLDMDDDNDGLLDGADQCPLDPACTIDTDSDGIDNVIDTDDDNDGALDVDDNCPFFASADQTNTDGDAQGNVCDTDDDNDGVADTSDKFPLNIAAASDTDVDGFPDSWNAECDVLCQSNSGLVLDNCPTTSNANQLNTDGDAQGDVCDADDDNDGVADGADTYPLNPAESTDSDKDGTGDNADTDDDNDTLLDTNDNCPFYANIDQLDEDNDGVGNPCDGDGDGPGKPDITFNPGMGANYYVYSVAPQADGKVLIGGMFTTVNGVIRNSIARLNSDGSLDASFNPGMGANHIVLSLVLQADGKLLIGGSFTTVNGVSRNRIARLNSDGSLDTSFNPGTGANNVVDSVVLQADGKVLIGGEFITVNGVSRKYIARLNSDGTLDTGFNPGTGASNVVTSVALQADGKVLIVGGFTTVNGVSRNCIARLNSDGSLDASFNPGTGAGGGGAVNFVALKADGKVLIGGNFMTVNGVSRNRIARLNSDGSLDTGFNPGTGANNVVYSVVPQADGKVLIGGAFTEVNGISRNYIARLDSDGSLDTGFNPGTGAGSNVHSVALQADGKALIGGGFTNYNGTNINRIARIHTGDVDQDGIEDAADYFSNNAAAALDTDRDSLPDAWLQPNGFGCVANANSCNGLTLDNDNDNDGAPDYLDPEPLNPANSSVWPLNSNYKGSAMRESQGLAP